MANTASLSSLKADNSKAIWLLVSTDIILIALVLTGFSFTKSSLIDLAQSALFREILSLSAGPIVAVFLNDLLPSNLKASIVFFRFKNALPGHRAFSKHALSDPRIDIEALKKKIGEFPENPRHQNTFWYRLYQKHQSSIIVNDSHKRFLLFRDLAALTFMMLIISTIFFLFFYTKQRLYTLVMCGLSIQFFWFAFSARNTGIRLVQNVLAIESTDHGEEIK